MTSWDRHATSWEHTYTRDVVASFGVGVTLDGRIEEGTQVTINGLNNPQLNGCLGIVTNAAVSEGRAEITVVGSSIAPKSIKYANLTAPEITLSTDNRIGSDSANGAVYRATLQSEANICYVAVKFTSDSKEGAIAAHFGDLTRKDLDNPYPLVLGYGLCPPHIAEQFARTSSGKVYYIISELAAGDFHQILRELKTAHGTKGQPSYVATYAAQRFAVHGTWEADTTIFDVANALYTQAALALNHMHKDGYVHRDPHAGNFMVLGSGKVVIHDFDRSVLRDDGSVLKSMVYDKSNFNEQMEHAGLLPLVKKYQAQSKKTFKDRTLNP